MGVRINTLHTHQTCYNLRHLLSWHRVPKGWPGETMSQATGAVGAAGCRWPPAQRLGPCQRCCHHCCAHAHWNRRLTLCFAKAGRVVGHMCTPMGRSTRICQGARLYLRSPWRFSALLCQGWGVHPCPLSEICWAHATSYKQHADLLRGTPHDELTSCAAHVCMATVGAVCLAKAGVYTLAMGAPTRGAEPQF